MVKCYECLIESTIFYHDIPAKFYDFMSFNDTQEKTLSTVSNWMSDIFCALARHLNISLRNCISVDSRISPQDFHFDKIGFVLWKVPSLNYGQELGFSSSANFMVTIRVYCLTKKCSGSSIFSCRVKILFWYLHHPTGCHQCEIKIASGGASRCWCCHSFPSKFVEKSDDADIFTQQQRWKLDLYPKVLCADSWTRAATSDFLKVSALNLLLSLQITSFENVVKLLDFYKKMGHLLLPSLCFPFSCPSHIPKWRIYKCEFSSSLMYVATFQIWRLICAEVPMSKVKNCLKGLETVSHIFFMDIGVWAAHHQAHYSSRKYNFVLPRCKKGLK